jgi:hypothetical protein
MQKKSISNTIVATRAYGLLEFIFVIAISCILILASIQPIRLLAIFDAKHNLHILARHIKLGQAIALNNQKNVLMCPIHANWAHGWDFFLEQSADKSAYQHYPKNFAAILQARGFAARKDNCIKLLADGTSHQNGYFHYVTKSLFYTKARELVVNKRLRLYYRDAITKN